MGPVKTGKLRAVPFTIKLIGKSSGKMRSLSRGGSTVRDKSMAQKNKMRFHFNIFFVTFHDLKTIYHIQCL